MRKVLLFWSVMWLFFGFLLPSEPVTLQGVMKPDSITVDNAYLYVTENTTVHVFDVKEFKLKATFGKSGEGPGEFKSNLYRGGSAIEILPLKDKLFIHSVGKISFFSRSGEFQSEMRTGKSGRGKFLPFNRGFVYYSQGESEGKDLVTRVVLMDEKLAPVKEVYQTSFFLEQKGNFRIFYKNFKVQTSKEGIFLVDKEALHIAVFNQKGEPLSPITENYQQLSVSDKVKEKVREWFKTSPRTRDYWEMLKDKIDISPIFPAIRDFWVTGNRVVVLTYGSSDNKVECYVFDLQGKKLGKQWLRFYENNIMENYPTTCYQDRFYQLVENPDTESWELVVTPLEI